MNILHFHAELRSTEASCDLTIPTCTLETRVRFSVVWTQCVSRRSNESSVHLKCLYKWQGAVRRPTFSFWSPPPCTSGSWSHIPTSTKSGAGPNLVIDVFSCIFDRPIRFIFHKQIISFYRLICTRSVIFCFIIFAILSNAVYIVFVVRIAPPPRIFRTDIFISFPFKSRFFRPFLFNISGHVWKQMSFLWSSSPYSLSSS